MSRAEENREASPLLAILRARIEREGPLPVDAYMRTCLAHPEHGYWRGADYLGLGCGAWGTVPMGGERIRYRNTPVPERYVGSGDFF